MMKVNALGAALLLSSICYAGPILAQEGPVDALVDKVGNLVGNLPLVGGPLAGVVELVDGTLDDLLGPLPLVGGLVGDGPDDDQDASLLDGLGGLTLGGNGGTGVATGLDGGSATTGGSAGAGLLGTSLGTGGGTNAILPPL